ncbi:MAG: T9SS type A sorting domain-containing protein [Melioribacteraceae bacterium]|nr:T9SS type A sorting domain-containing protein [Melioribacteraceae bacterium]
MWKTIFLILLLSQTIYAQLYPITYKIKGERSNKISDITPASNSILNIIANDDLIILGTNRGLSLSEDNGENWNNYYQTEPFGGDGTTAIGYDNGVIWTTTGRTTEVEGGALLPEGTGIKYSTDNGSTWASIPQPVDELGDSSIVYGINTLRALPITTTISNITYDISFTKNTIWITSFAGGLRKSSDKGKTWERVVLPPDTLNSISPNDTLNFALQPVAGAFGPESWLNHRVFSVLGVDDSTLYVGTAGGINKSTDNGVSWQKFSHQNQVNPISGNFVVGLGKNEADNSIWAATWKAADAHEFWGVSHSSDGGENWEVTLLDEKAHNFGFKYLPNGESHIFVPTDRGMFRSKDNGAAWIEPNEIKDSNTNVSITTTIFYSAASNKLSATEYNIWVGSNNGLARLTETDGFWEGDWKVYIAPTDVKDEISPTQNQFKLEQNYPNPFNPSTVIKYSIPSVQTPLLGGVGLVTLKIYDILGREVATLVNKNQKAGNYEVVFIASNLTSGVYYYRLQSGSMVVTKKLLLLK